MLKNLQYDFSSLIKHRKQDIVVVIFAIVLLIIITSIVIILFSEPPQTNNKTTVAPTIQVTPYVTPSFYNPTAESKLGQKVVNRIPLSPKDTTVKNTTLNTILHGYNSGIVYQSPNVQVEYMQSLDIFMAEILTTDIAGAKNETIAWFLSQGFSQQGICNLPIMFYLSPEVRQQLQDSPVSFNPLPDNC